jgi:hypothetical protein
MRKFIKFVVTAILCFCSIAVMAQGSASYKHEIGIDVANALTFLSKKKESYLINYKWHFDKKNALRSGLDIDWSNGSDGYKILNLRIGYERKFPVALNRWQLYYGADGKFSYWSRNFMPNYYTRWGLSPLIGVSYYFSPCVSVSTEAGINFHYTNYRNPESRISEDNENVFEINVGYVGMMAVSYHF